jgi:hypothetical protein
MERDMSNTLATKQDLLLLATREDLLATRQELQVCRQDMENRFEQKIDSLRGSLEQKIDTLQLRMTLRLGSMRCNSGH